MQILIERLMKLVLATLIATLIGICAASKATSGWSDGKLAIGLDSEIFAEYFSVSLWIHRSLLLLVAVSVGLLISDFASGYFRKLSNSLIKVGPSWHHYLCAMLLGTVLGTMTHAVSSACLANWFLFDGDGALAVLGCLAYGAFMHPAPAILTEAKPTQPQDIIGVSTLVDYISRRIGSAFESKRGPLPKTLAIAGERGSGKSYILEEVKLKLANELGLKCQVFKPWNFDSHTLFYEEVMGYLFKLLEEEYVVPKPKTLVNGYISSFCDGPKKTLGTFLGHLFGDFSSEKRTLHDAEMWIRQIENIVLIFDDLDRCHQGELRHVFRLMDRLTLFENIFIVASIDRKTLDRIGKFENKIEIPVKVTS